MTDWSFMSDFAAGVMVAGSTACIEVFLRLRGMHRHKRTAISALGYIVMAAAHSSLRASGVAAFQTWALEGAVFALICCLLTLREGKKRRARVAEVVAQIETYKAEWEKRRTVD
jgi:peptidoglycan/LPS O-acetylase OafA/YrhL